VDKALVLSARRWESTHHERDGEGHFRIRRRMVTILVVERGDGVPTSYDLMASFIASGTEAALVVARDLHANVETPTGDG
jgi:hypothetical protein